MIIVTRPAEVIQLPPRWPDTCDPVPGHRRETWTVNVYRHRQLSHDLESLILYQYNMLAIERRGTFLWGMSILFKVPWCGIWRFQVQVTTMRPGRVGQTRNIKYPKLSRAMTMLPLYNHQHPVQVIKAQNQENHNISPSQPQVRGGAMAMALNHGISITNWPEQRSETSPLSRAW